MQTHPFNVRENYLKAWSKSSKYTPLPCPLWRQASDAAMRVARQVEKCSTGPVICVSTPLSHEIWWPVIRITLHCVNPEPALFTLLTLKLNMGDITSPKTNGRDSFSNQVPSNFEISSRNVISEDAEYHKPSRLPVPCNCAVHLWSLYIWHFAIVGSLNKLLIKIKEHPYSKRLACWHPAEEWCQLVFSFVWLYRVSLAGATSFQAAPAEAGGSQNEGMGSNAYNEGTYFYKLRIQQILLCHCRPLTVLMKIYDLKITFFYIQEELGR